MTAPRHLKAVPRPRAQRVLDYRCDLVTQAMLGGDIDFRVQAMSPVVGPGPGTISIRLGRVMLVLEDRDALEVLITACRQAESMAERAFGPEMPPAGLQAAAVEIGKARRDLTRPAAPLTRGATRATSTHCHLLTYEGFCDTTRNLASPCL